MSQKELEPSSNAWFVQEAETVALWGLVRARADALYIHVAVCLWKHNLLCTI